MSCSTWLKISLCGILFFANAQAEQHRIWLDPNLSMYVGAEDLLTMHWAVMTSEDYFAPAKLWSENQFLGKAGGIAYRLAKLSLLDFTIDYFPTLIQHEYFGHGYRFREYGVTDMNFLLRLPPPYDNGGGSTQPKRGIDRQWSRDEWSAIATAGVEADAILANHVKRHWMAQGKIDYHEVLLYYFSEFDLHNYIEADTAFGRDQGNDMLHYLDTLNVKAGYSAENPKLSLQRLRNRDFVNYVNPFFFFSLYSLIHQYLWYGEKSTTLPTIPLGPVNYLPMLRLGLSPYGSEVYVENWLQYHDKTINAYWRQGDGILYDSWGFGLQSQQLLNYGNMTFDFDYHFWQQPNLILGGDVLKERGTSPGQAFILGGFIPVTRDIPFLNFSFAWGYKTAGFLAGESLDDGAFIRAGIAWNNF